MRAKSLALLVLALGCGLVASIGITQVMAKRDVDTGVDADQNAIFVAMEDIAFGVPLNSQVLRLEQWPKDKIPVGALSRIEDIEGRVPRTNLYAGEPVLENKLYPAGVGDSASGSIPKGYRVKGVKVDQVSGGGLLQPGDRVDVMVQLVRNPSMGIPETSTRTILEDIRVFAVNDIYKPSSVDAEEKIIAKTVRLLVTPEQAAKIMLAEKLGSIQLVMRGPDETEISGPGPVVTTEDLLGTSDRADRVNEEPKVPEPGRNDGSIVDLLNGMRFQKDPTPPSDPTVQQPAPAETTDTVTWPIRVMRGSEVEEVFLQKEIGQSAGDADSGHWRPVVMGLGPDGAASQPWLATTDPDAEEEQEPAEEPSEEEPLEED